MASQTAAQMSEVVRKMPKTEWSNPSMGTELSEKRKMELLTLLPKGDSVQFEFPDYDPHEVDMNRYFGLDTTGLHYIDLDSDGDLDLLYSGTSGWLGMMDTKVYLNQDNQYKFIKVLNGRLLDIRERLSGYEVYTLWVPCCGSYTSRIEKYLFLDDRIAEFRESISIIGRLLTKGIPDFSNLKPAYIKNVNLSAQQADFRGVHPHFRNKQNAKLDTIRAGKPISALFVKGRVDVNIIKTQTIKDKEWYLIITTPLLLNPKSLYEWSSGSNRRFIGWVDKVYFD